MAAVAVAPIVLKNATLKVDVDNYESAVSEVSFVPSVAQTQVQFKGINGATYSETTTQGSTWVCNLTYAQDWETPGSLSNYLHENEGEEISCEFVPEAGSSMPKFTATLTVVPGQIGGPVDQVLTATVALPSTKPAAGTTTI